VKRSHNVIEKISDNAQTQVWELEESRILVKIQRVTAR
jgi:hypothetical protein